MELLNVEEKPNPCKGKIFRGHVNAFIRENGGYVYQECMTPLKKLSCPGCPKCGGMEDMLREMVPEEYHPMIKDIKDQALYQLKVVNISYDYESGFVDDWDLEFIICESKEEK